MPASLCRRSLVPLVLVIMIAALPAGAGADTIQRSFGNWKATFSGTFDDNVSDTVSGTVKGAFRATTDAGVGERDRAQSSDATSLYVGEVSGQLQFDDVDSSGCPAIHEHYTWAATKLLDRSFGGVPFELKDQQDVGALGESGSGSYVSDPCGVPPDDFPGCSTGLKQSTTYGPGYVYFQREGSSLKATAITFGWIATDSACGVPPGEEPGAGIGSGSFPISAIGSPTITVQLSLNKSDGLGRTWRGSGTLTLHRVQDEVRAQELAIGPATLLQHVNLQARTTPPGATVQSYQWETRRSHTPTWTTLATTPKPAYSFTAELAGHFKLRTVLNGVRPTPHSVPRQVVTPQIGLEVRFPTRDQIVANRGVDNFTLYAWGRTLALATPHSRQELGFWIALDTCTGTFHKTPTILGPPVPSHKKGRVNLGPQPPDSRPPTGVKGCAIYWVATFHTHTPTTYRTPHTKTRRVGPSSQDKTNATNRKMPGLVYDYIAHPRGTGKIPYGYPKHSPHQVYRYGPVRRSTPP